ncbi:hypothetical protein DFH28DRAFT_928184 [Melampsora americana]|nr:hypothetical protein DFH28DRAFT_928184 [Melampsora americana]
MDNRLSKILITTPDLKAEMGYELELTNISDISPPPAKKPEPQQHAKKKAKKTGQQAFQYHKIPNNLLPHKPAHHFDSVYQQQSQVADHPRLTYFIQHTQVLNLGNIPNSVDNILADFSILEPLTSCQENLH